MPEQRHHLAQRGVGGNHLLKPPGAQVVDLRRVAGAVARRTTRYSSALMSDQRRPPLIHTSRTHSGRAGGLAAAASSSSESTALSSGIAARRSASSGVPPKQARLSRWRAASASQAGPLTGSAAGAAGEHGRRQQEKERPKWASAAGIRFMAQGKFLQGCDRASSRPIRDRR